MDTCFGDAELEELVVLHAHEWNRAADVIICTFEKNAVLDSLKVDQPRIIVILALYVDGQRLVVEDKKTKSGYVLAASLSRSRIACTALLRAPCTNATFRGGVCSAFRSMLIIGVSPTPPLIKTIGDVAETSM